MMLQKVRFRCLVARFSRQSGTPCLMQGSETVDRAGDITGFIGVEPFHAQCLLCSAFELVLVLVLVLVLSYDCTR